MDVRKYLEHVKRIDDKDDKIDISNTHFQVYGMLEQDWPLTAAGRASYQNLLTTCANTMIIDFPSLREEFIEDCFFAVVPDRLLKRVKFTCILRFKDDQSRDHARKSVL